MKREIVWTTQFKKDYRMALKRRLDIGNHMIQIRPVSDLRNKFPDIEKIVNDKESVYLTKNGYQIRKNKNYKCL